MPIRSWFAWLFALFLIFAGLPAQAGTITTYAGGGASLLDGELASAAQLRAPWGVAFDTAGNLYLSNTETLGLNVRRVDAISGRISTVAGNGIAGNGGDGGPATAASFILPTGLAFDPNPAGPYLYIGDTGGYRVRRLDLGTGFITTVAGNGSRGTAGDNGLATGAQLLEPRGLAVAANGDLYIADGNALRRVEFATGIIRHVSYGQTNTSIAVKDVAIDSAGSLYVLDIFQTTMLWRVDPATGSGVVVAGGGTGAAGPALAADISGAETVEVDNFGGVYLASNHSVVWRFDSASNAINLFAGTGVPGLSGDGGSATAARINGVGDVAAAANGDLYLVDRGNSRVRKVIPQSFYANSPSGQWIDADGRNRNSGNALRKFVDPLPVQCDAASPIPVPSGGNGVALTGKCIPVAVPDKATYPGSDYYEIGIVEYSEPMHADLPKATRLRGYVQLNDPDRPVTRDASGQIVAWPQTHYLGPLIRASQGRPVRIQYTNLLPVGQAGKLFLPVDTTTRGAGLGPDGTPYPQNRASLQLEGGDAPWISGGTPHQWITPAAEGLSPSGVSKLDVPDMPAPEPGSATLYWPNGLSARMLSYHDNTYGIADANIYAGEAALYLLTDSAESTLLAGVLAGMGEGIPLVLQDKTFVPADVGVQDSRWIWGTSGDLWAPHVYEFNESDPSSGVSPTGRWHFGPWFFPPSPASEPPPAHPYLDLNPSRTPDAFHDTPVVNGVAYPTWTVEPRAYRFRIRNASNDRFWNLGLYVAADRTTQTGPDAKGIVSYGPFCSGTINHNPENCTEVSMVDFVRPAGPSIDPFPARWGATHYATGEVINRPGGVPDPATIGPPIVQIGNEAGLLPRAMEIPSTPINWNYDKGRITYGNVLEHGLLLAPGEVADVVVDFSGHPGSTLILYNDAPAPLPAGDPRSDYYTGAPDQTANGGAPSPLAGFGPNTRTVLQFRVAPSAADPAFDVAALNSDLAKAYVVKPIVPQTVVARILDTDLIFNAVEPLTYRNAAGLRLSVPAGMQVTMPILKKSLHDELFDPVYGREMAAFGVETISVPFTSLNFIDPPSEVIDAGETQLWRIVNNGVETHALHFPLLELQVVNRVGWDTYVSLPEANELGWKQTVRTNPLEELIVAVRAKIPPTPFVVPTSRRLLDPTQAAGATQGFAQVDPLTGNPAVVSNVETDFGWEYAWQSGSRSQAEFDLRRPLVIRVQTAPPAPINLTVIRIGGYPTLTWSDASPSGDIANELGFRIERSADALGPYMEIGQVAADVTSYTDTSAGFLGWYYRVVAYNDAGGANSAPVVIAAEPPDTIPPVFGALPSPDAEASGPLGALVNYTLPTATDNAPGTVTVDCAPASGSQFALGISPVNCLASDAAGNTATAGFNVTVRDTQPPQISGLPANIVVNNAPADGQTVSWIAPTALDAVDGPLAVNCTPAAGSVFPLGTTAVSCSVSDAAGNVATAGFTVSLLAPAPVGNTAPLAKDDQIYTRRNVAARIPVLANDRDAEGNLDPGSVVVVQTPSKGTAQVNADGTVTYTPPPGYKGEVKFYYRVSDTAGAQSRKAQVTVKMR